MALIDIGSTRPLFVEDYLIETANRLAVDEPPRAPSKPTTIHSNRDLPLRMGFPRG
ncbi:MAG: hypothetical protein OXH50_17100 [Gemmatimonadetes bacterium]|nr:hypothetical protein [Gemmatimonadota bacterium]